MIINIFPSFQTTRISAVNVAGFPLRCNNRGLSKNAVATTSTNSSSSGTSGSFTPEMVMNMVTMFAQMGGNPQATSAGLANLQINTKKRKALPDEAPGKSTASGSQESQEVNVAVATTTPAVESLAKTTPAVESLETAQPVSSGKPLLALENKALELPNFDYGTRN